MRNAVTTEKEEVVSLMPDATSISSVRDRRWWILGVVGLAQLMVVLDGSFLPVNLPVWSAQGCDGAESRHPRHGLRRLARRSASRAPPPAPRSAPPARP